MPSVPAVAQGSSKSRGGFSLRAFGREITITKSPVGATDISPLIGTGGGYGGGWFPIIREPFTGAWQRNIEVRRETIVAFSAVYSCATLISSDIGKVRIRLVEQDKNMIWSEVYVPAFSPILEKPNRWQNRIKFFEQWVLSKLLHGNTYVLKERDGRGVVIEMYVLDPTRVKPLVAPNGDVYYEILKDNLAGVEQEKLILPDSEIIHDTMSALFHPLCGVSPLAACGLAASNGLTIQQNSSRFFKNDSTPGGILTAPGAIDQSTAERIKQAWEANMTGENRKRVAVMGDGMTYTKMGVDAKDAQMLDQLKWDELNVCSAFHVPPYMIGVGPPPAYNNIEAINQQYYTQCLQTHIESIELCLDEGLGLTDHQAHTYGTEFDLDDLLRMDTLTQIEALSKAVGGSIMTPNAALKKMNQKPVTGGDTIYMQQQNFSLDALNRRDKSDDPFALAPKRDQNTPSPAQEVAAEEAVANPGAASAPPAGKSFDDELDTAAQYQIAKWALQEALEVQLTKMAA